MEELLAPGFRFFPTEEELLSFYLHKKLQGKSPELHRVISVIDIYKYEPWHLPNLSGELCRGDTEQWFFFTPRQEREARGGRPNRITASGYWKATGSPGYVYSLNNRVIGVRRNMVFYRGKAPTGRKTKWKMNEYIDIEAAAAISCNSPIPKYSRHEFSLCRVYVTSGSLRAFDRRPTKVMTRQIMTQQVHDEGAATTSKNTQMVEKTSSLKSSYSGRNHVDLPTEAVMTRQIMTQQVHDEGAATSKNTQMVEKTNSLESSYSGGNQVDLPTEAVMTRQKMSHCVHDEGAATTSKNTQMVEKTSSLESSYSGGNHVDLPKTAVGSANLQIFDGLESLWDWEQILDWF